MAHRVIYAILLLFVLSTLKAQQFPVIKLSVEEGLGHSIVYRTFQTKNGYIWFSTDNGLTRYDGATFRNFTSEDGLPSTFIFDLQEWNDKLYISTLGGGLMTLADGHFYPAFDSTFHAPLHPIELSINEHGTFIIDRFKELSVLDGERFKRVTHADLGIPPTSPLEFYQVYNAGSFLYAASNHGLIEIRDGKFSLLQLPVNGSVAVFRIAKFQSYLYLAMKNNLMVYDLDNGKIWSILDKEEFSRHSTLVADSENNIWASAVSGRFYLLKQVSPGNFSSRKILEDIIVNNIFEDREQNIWLSTYGDGAWYIQSTHVRNYPIKGGIVLDLVVLGDRRIVPTINSGLKLFGQDENRFLFEISDTRLQALFQTKPYLTRGISTDDGSLLVSSSRTLYKWSDRKADSIQVTNPVSSIFHQKSKNRFVIGSRFSLAFCDESLTATADDPGLVNLIVRAIVEDFDGTLVLGTDKGIWKENAHGFEQVKTDDMLLKSDVNAFYKDASKDQIWVGTNAGLALYRHGKITLFDEPVTRVRCNAIAGDEKGQLWIGTVRGLLYFNGKTFELLNTKEGLAQSNIIQLHYDKHNRLLTLLSNNYLSLIDTENISEITTYNVPDILVERIRSGDVEYDVNSIAKVTSLEPGMRQLDIRLSTPMIRNRDKIRYRYRINNMAWTDFNGNEISLHSLPYGELTITVKAFKHNREDDFKISEMVFFLPPPFYLKWWFIVATILIMGGIVAIMIVWYARRRHNILIEENKKLDVEHKALRNLLNPHFLYNAINSIHAFILQNDQKQTLGYLSKFSQLVRLNLDLLATDHASLDKEIKNISLYLEFEKLRFDDKLNYSIEIDPDIRQSEIVLPSFIIQPFVENAIWHGLLLRAAGGNLNLSIYQKGNKITIIIDDDGIGINESLIHPKTEIDKKTSMGIHIIRERFELLKKVSADYSLSIIDKSDLNGKATGTGTRITITIPAAPLV